jgi:hypothetical protein
MKATLRETSLNFALLIESCLKARNTIIQSIVVSIAICCGLLATVPAQGQNVESKQHPPTLFPTNEWGTVTNNCQLGLRVPKFQYVSGEEIVATVILRNVGDKNLGYIHVDEYRDYEVIVKRADGRTVPYTDSWARFDRSHPIQTRIQASLGPHQETLASSGWVHVNSRYKMDVPGEYIITVQRNVSGPTGWFDVLSNPVTVTIVAPSLTKPEK